MMYKPLPIGVDDFEKLIENGFYYVDKSWFIKELLDMKAEVNLFTRPRRFGKTLNLSMLRYFFESPVDGTTKHHLFSGLNIMESGEQYISKQEGYCVISLNLKSAKQANFEYSYGCLQEVIAKEFSRHSFVIPKLKTNMHQEKFKRIMNQAASDTEYLTSIAYLSECLYEYCGKKTIILIDEYDVPLENAYYAGFYKEMLGFIRALFESALKTNQYLEFAVITGCLRISKESIFTGLNNLEMISILNDNYGEHFGFSENEVKEMLHFYNRDAHLAQLKEWYNGYRFGNTEVYNPWSVINHVKALYSNEQAFPMAYWSNTSSNDIVRDLVEKANLSAKEEIETLIAGGVIEKKIHEDITYEDIGKSEENLWNFLFFTGYLKIVQRKMLEDELFIEMAIPNKEVRSIYREKIIHWFGDEIKVRDLSRVYKALMEGDAATLEKEIMELLKWTISYMDSKEEFYHGFLLGILANMEDYLVKSNREAGLGRYDICVRSLDVTRTPAIIELKVSPTYKGLENHCDAAIQQINDMRYDDVLPEEGYTEVLTYGIAFFKKQCCVKVERKLL